MDSNNRFRLSNMMPNSWFYKLKDMGRAQGGSQRMSEAMKRWRSATTASPTSTKLKPMLQPSTQHGCIPARSSFYYSSKERTEKLPHSPVNTKASDTHFPTESPRRSVSTPRGTLPKPYVAADGDLRRLIMEKHTEYDNCEVITSASTDVAIESSKKSFNRREEFEDMEVVSELKLPPIITKPSTQKQVHSSALDRSTVLKEKNDAIQEELSSTAGARVTRGEKYENYGKQKVQLQNKMLSASFVVVKSSMDPQNDFWASMVEMIVENEIRRRKDLEELLACYLSLNSKEFHEIIIKVFVQIWFDLGLHRK